MCRQFSCWAILSLVSIFLILAGDVSRAWAYGPGPEGIVVSPDGKWVYVTNSASQAIEVIDTATHQLAFSMPIDTGGYFVPCLAISPDGARLYVTIMARDQVLVIDTGDRRVVAAVKVGSVPVGVGLGPDGKRLYVANQNDDTVSVIDTGTLQTIGRVEVGSRPNYVAVSPDGQRLYVANTAWRTAILGDGTVSVIDTTGLRVIATVPVAAWPNQIAVNPNGKWVYVTHIAHDAIQVDALDTATHGVVSTLKGGFVGLAVSPDGGRVYAGSSQSLAVLDAATLRVVATVKVGSEPYNLAVAPDGQRLYAASKFDRRVVVIDTSTLQVVATVKMGDHAASQ